MGFLDPALPTSTAPVAEGSQAMIVAPRPAALDRGIFNKALTSGVDPAWGSTVRLGSGMTVAQSGGNLVITSGTTVNAETIIRSANAYVGGWRARIASYMSQRIVNCSAFFELVDVQGDGLACTIDSATQVTVTWPAGQNPFDVTAVGSSAYLGGYSASGTGVFIPGRYAITAVTATTAVFAVTGFTAGAGTCSVFGWSFHHILYDGSTSGTVKYDAGRKGWNSGDSSMTTNTSATPGDIITVTQNDGAATATDNQVGGSATGIRDYQRGSRDMHVPDDIALRVQLRLVNGSTAPTSSTTWSINRVVVEQFSPVDVTIQDTRPLAAPGTLSVNVPGGVVAQASTNRVGFTAASVMQWYQSQSTTIAAAAQYPASPAVRDAFAVGTGSAPSSATYAKEYRVKARAMVAATLYVEMSDDSSNWDNAIAPITMTQIGGSGAYIGIASVVPVARYYRARIVVGATATGATLTGLTEVLLAA